MSEPDMTSSGRAPQASQSPASLGTLGNSESTSGRNNGEMPKANSDNAASPSVVYQLTRNGVQTRHLVVYNTGPAVGVDELTLRRVFEAYGTVERVLCPNPASARVLITFAEVST